MPAVSPSLPRIHPTSNLIAQLTICSSSQGEPGVQFLFQRRQPLKKKWCARQESNSDRLARVLSVRICESDFPPSKHWATIVQSGSWILYPKSSINIMECKLFRCNQSIVTQSTTTQHDGFWNNGGKWYGTCMMYRFIPSPSRALRLDQVTRERFL